MRTPSLVSNSFDQALKLSGSPTTCGDNELSKWKGSYRFSFRPRRGRDGLFGSTGYPAASQASIPPISTLTCRNPLCESVHARLALVASSGQAQ